MRLTKGTFFISLFLIFLYVTLCLSVSSALETNFSCPNFVSAGEEFKCKIKVWDFSGVYDVKVDISAEGKTIAQVWHETDGKWKSCFYYIEDFVNSEDEKEIRLNISENFQGDVVGFLKLRQNNQIKYTENFSISVSEKSGGTEPESKAREENKSNNEVKDEKTTIDKNEKNETEISGSSINQNSIIQKKEYSKNESVINLDNPANIKESKILYESKNEKIGIYAIYGFSVFLIFVIVVLIIRK